MIRSVRAEAARRGRPLPPPVELPVDIQGKLERGLPLTAAEVARARAAIRRKPGPPGGHHGHMATATADAPSYAAMRANALSCPHNRPIPPEQRAGCGCSRWCEAGKSPREDGGVTILDCWGCSLAPRLRSTTMGGDPDPAPPDDHGGTPPPGHGHGHGHDHEPGHDHGR